MGQDNPRQLTMTSPSTVLQGTEVNKDPAAAVEVAPGAQNNGHRVLVRQMSLGEPFMAILIRPYTRSHLLSNHAPRRGLQCSTGATSRLSLSDGEPSWTLFSASVAAGLRRLQP